MKVLVLGSNGFIGKNFVTWIKERKIDTLTYDKDNKLSELPSLINEADYIFDFIGANRTPKVEEFKEVNTDLTNYILSLLKELDEPKPFIYTSSIQADNDTPYGQSKKAAEDLIINFSKEHHYPIYVYRLYNVFGKWCKPNYNSVVATWCYNFSHRLPCEVNENNPLLKLVYIDDIMEEFLRVIKKEVKSSLTPLYVEPHYEIHLHVLLDIIEGFKDKRKSLFSPLEGDELKRKLYATYLSYLDIDDFGYDLVSHTDNRGSFTEFIKTLGDGQVSIVTSHPGVVRGNHYHHTKNEKFLVVKGECEISFRKIDEDKIVTYKVDGNHLRVIDIPVGYTHAIKNVGKDDAIIVIWASEVFDPNRPDTIALNVEKEDVKD